MVYSQSFPTNKGFLTNENIAIKCKGEIITDATKLADIFNIHYRYPI